MMCCLYMMVVDAGDGTSFCKIGITGDLDKRVRGVQTGCPLPITEVAYLEIGPNQLRGAERLFHDKLAKYQSSGEWFRFNFADTSQKADFAEATRAVIRWAGISGSVWKTMNLESIKMLSKVLRLDKVA